ncbi:hypothetical protein WJX74_009238 [Apatococcus lobatus]|uniref:histidine kinase n=1 Tax=Apatococcus lobatus TaxID=904363 RepID=A0AAW1SB01_9CHLO
MANKKQQHGPQPTRKESEASFQGFRLDPGWKPTWAIVLTALSCYAGIVYFFACFPPKSAEAVAVLFKEVPRDIYAKSNDWFTATLFISIISFLLESTPARRQLACLSFAIKLVAWHADYAASQPGVESFVWLDNRNQPLLVLRYGHWTVATPMIVYLISRLSDFTWLRTMGVMFIQALVIITGFLALVLPLQYELVMWAASFIAFGYVLMALWKMAASAMRVKDLKGILPTFKLNPLSLGLILGAVVGCWLLFPVFILAYKADMLSLYQAETLLARLNFCAKALLSSGAMYGGFLTLDQRREIAHMAQEHARAKLVATLRDTIHEKDQLMSMLSHELRTPMNGVIGLSEALLCGNCGPLNDKTSTFVHTIHQSSCLLLNMINDILDAAAMNHGKLAIRHEKVNIKSLIGQVVDTLAHMARPGVQIVKDVQHIPHIIGDGGRITQILFNLIGNALKFTDRGSIVIRVTPGADHVKLVIKDTGCGIPEEKHAQIFQPFEQADMSMTRKFGGTGLGLHIVKVLVEAHNGSIKVNSSRGEGAAFTVILPINASKSSDSLLPVSALSNGPKVAASTFSLQRYVSFPSKPSTSKDGSSPVAGPANVITDVLSGPPVSRISWEGTRIPKRSLEIPSGLGAKSLSEHSSKFWSTCKPTHSELHGIKLALIVDDDEIGHVVVAQCLEPLGYKLVAYTDAMSALAWLQDLEFVPDIVLLDYMMPEMSGTEFCTIFRETIPRSVVPVIMISAKTDEESIVKALNVGCNDFLTKPVRREELNARIELHTAMKTDAAWLKSLMNGSTSNDTEAMQLLQAIMPQKIIAKIQNGQKFIAETHPNVVILFSDIVGFTTLSSKLPTSEIFMLLSNMFAAFDRLVDRFGIYKVETIGDAYMAVAGHDEDAAKGSMGRPVDRMLQMACAMLDVVNDLTMLDGSKVKIRVGVHCGSAFSGVISLKCPRYCFVGDAINVASRMESSGFPMTIHVSDAIANELRDTSLLAPCGPRTIKGKGDMQTYLMKVGQWEFGLDILRQSSTAPTEWTSDSHTSIEEITQIQVSIDYSFQEDFSSN